jgi:SAM-dependent methyltransferase
MYFDFRDKPERLRVKEMVHGYNISCGLFVAVKLGLADRLAEGPLTLAELAQGSGTDPDALKRILRLLMSAGFFTVNERDECALTPRAGFLRTDHPESIASEVQLFAGEETYLAWSELLHCVRTGRTGFKQFFGKPLFEYLSEHPDSAERFHRGWHEISIRAGLEISEAIDFMANRHIIDVGGGYGIVTAHLLRKYGHLRGTIYDLEFSLAGAARTMQEYGVDERCAIEPGDGMIKVPDGGDVHLLKSVLHILNDNDSVLILSNCANALDPDGRVLVLERVIREDGAYVWGNVVDVAMLVMTGGRERTLQDYARLYQRAGLRFIGSTLLPCGFSVIEGRK